MSYTTINFKTKKALKEAVASWKEFKDKFPIDGEICEKEGGKPLLHNGPVRCYNPGLGHDLSDYTGSVGLEGPHYPAAHTWYCVGEMVNGILVKVK